MNSKIHTIRLDTHYENMLKTLVQFYRDEMSKTGLTVPVSESSVIRTAIEREYNRNKENRILRKVKERRNERD